MSPQKKPSGTGKVSKQPKEKVDTESMEKVLSILNKMKQVCVELYPGDEEQLQRDIEQDSRKEIEERLGAAKQPEEPEESPKPITIKEIEQMLPLKINRRSTTGPRSKQDVDDNIEKLLQRSDRLKLARWKAADAKKKE